MNIVHIDSLEAPYLHIYAEKGENQLMHFYEPEPGLFIAESPNVIRRAMDAGYELVSVLTEERFLEPDVREITEGHDDVPVYLGSMELLKVITGFPMLRGILAAMRRRELPSVEETCRNAKRIAVLENVVNPTNVGAIIRSAAALGMDAVLLTPGSSDPLYRRSARVSMGTCFQIPWTFTKSTDPKEWIGELHDIGFKTVAMALLDDTLNIDAPELKKEEKLAIILGTEGEGLKKETIEKSDYTVCIPMKHGVDSLNVAAASAVAFWELLH